MSKKPNSDDPFLSTRVSLLGRLRNCEDHDSWRTFFESYWRLIYSFAIRAGLGEHEAQEVVQETIISVAGTMSKFKYDPDACSFKSWLRHLTERRIADQIRKRPKTLLANDSSGNRDTDVLQTVPDPAGNDFEAIWHAEWQENLQSAALQKLQTLVKAKHYQIYLLHVIQGKGAVEVSSLCDVNAATVYVIKHRLSRMLHEIVRKLDQNPM
jgi:RNA polymerase sigma-70 factor (ECF subfamily)